ncbi:phosphonate metabolism protein/1,5-bisphosphokinase (PRPP-forming) PhnN [Paludibacterium paludis]|uniref:Ribose 1,5-bisphosphate phosphokinase PhnN n=1 Tax=Paludibacterium paludis TaxID=1225769 RepID=A0A918U7D4_9NEIS|nr:phosphonate metabolism protein/1,5-bisphosphokinase (PRPP-forming) PhnN [Paludibacterium paludis]GGY04103.1 ribose 1,5-bisphosphate phosphokinase PhnN [Paludibacterium paludis]
MRERGRVWYLIGPSGAGKDSVMARAREQLAPGAPVLFAHRYITRPARAGGENHVELSEAEFCAREARGLFALTWRSHGLRYGIGLEVEGWLAAGFDVVVNGSRHALDTARSRFAGMRPVVVTAPVAMLADRLARRGRESAEAIALRLAAARWDSPEDALEIVNDGELDDAGRILLSALMRT